jgi:EF hand
MLKVRYIGLMALAVVLTPVHAQNNVSDFITNMHFDAKDMDTNNDHMVSRAEMRAYAEKMWETMSNGKATIPIALSTENFATAGVNMDAVAMDTDNDGSISKQEFVAYTLKRYDAMPKTNGMVSVDVMAKAFVRVASN